MMFHIGLMFFFIAFSAMVFMPFDQTLGYLAFFTSLSFFTLLARCGLAKRVNRDGLSGVVFSTFSMLTIVVTVGLAAGFFRVAAVLDAQFPAELEGQTLSLEGYIVEALESESEYLRFKFKPSSESSPVKGPIRLSWKSDILPRTGEHWRFDLRLKRPRGMVNQGGFDYQAWLLSSGLVASGYVYGENAQRLAVADEGRRYVLMEALTRWRSQLLQRFKSKLRPKYDSSPLMLALLFGDKSAVTQDNWDVFQRSGTIHLMAISGLHVGMVAFTVALVLRALLRPLCLWFPPQYLRAITLSFASMSAFFYSAMAGFSVPTQRAFFCVLLLSLAMYWGRRLRLLSVLLVLAVALAMLNPMALTQPGFILSFGAVASLVYAFSLRQTRAHKLRVFIKAQLLMLMVLSPIMFAFNLPVALISPLANAIAIPLMSVIILPLLFLAALLSYVSDLASQWAFSLADLSLSGLFSFLVFFAKAPPLLLNTQLLSTLEIYLLVLAAFMFFSPSAFRLRAPGGCIYAAIVISLSLKPHSVDVQMDVLDVGQGLSVVFREEGHTLVYDIGAKYSEAFDIANRVLRPFLQATGIDHIDTLIISHADNDHAGAFDSFIERIPITAIYSGETEKLNLSSANRCYRGMPNFATNLKRQAARVSYQILWPELDASLDSKANNNSCVLLIRIDEFTVLLTGDIEKDVERHLLNAGVLPENIDVLVAAHHGSATSSTRRFVEYIKPRHVVFSAGYKNRYHHPAAKVTARYQNLGSTLWNTAYHGGIRIEFSNDSMKISARRCETKKRWYWSQLKNEDFCTF